MALQAPWPMRSSGGRRADFLEALIDDRHDVVPTCEGAKAPGYVRQQRRRWDVVLLDLMLPIMDRRTFLHACRGVRSCSSVPVVVLSAGYRVQSLAADLGPKVRATVPGLRSSSGSTLPSADATASLAEPALDGRCRPESEPATMELGAY